MSKNGIGVVIFTETMICLLLFGVMEPRNGGIGTEFAIDSMGQLFFVESPDSANGGSIESNKMESYITEVVHTNEYSYSLRNPLLP